MWWNLLLVLPLLADSSLLEQRLKNPPSPLTIAFEPFSVAEVGVWFTQEEALYSPEAPRANPIHSLDRFLIDMDQTRQHYENLINIRLRPYLPENSRIQLVPGSNRIHVEFVLKQ